MKRNKNSVTRLFKRVISLILLLCLTISFTFISSSARGSTFNSDGVAQTLGEKDLLIPEDIAYYIVEYFISDMVATETTIWDKDTAVIDTVIMYDETGNNVTGYTFNLTTGYVVISGYVDVPNIILEWSDEVKPVFYESNIELDEEDKIVYLGALEYYIDEGENDLVTIDGDTVSRDILTNEFDEQRDIKNVDENVLTAILEVKEGSDIFSNPGIATFSNWWGQVITDPGTYASNIYGGSFSCVDYANNWESYAKNLVTTGIASDNNNCGPTAITNTIKLYGKKYNNSTIKNSSDKSIYINVISANNAASPKYYTASGGTINARSDAFVRDSFKKYNVSVRTYGQYTVNYTNTVNALTPDNRLMFIMLSADKQYQPYGDHAVVGYAYTRIANNNGIYRAFIKVCDGWNSSARYVEIDSIAYAGSGAKYWEVYF